MGGLGSHFGMSFSDLGYVLTGFSVQGEKDFKTGVIKLFLGMTCSEVEETNARVDPMKISVSLIIWSKSMASIDPFLSMMSRCELSTSLTLFPTTS